MKTSLAPIAAIDLFCGAGGLSLGLAQAGVNVVAGIDLDPACRYPYERNLDAAFLLRDVADLSGDDLCELWPEGSVRLLAGCAPCQPFSSHRRGLDTRGDDKWSLLSHFSRLIVATRPELVTMENVVRLGSTTVFEAFVQTLIKLGYEVDYGVLDGPSFGLAQRRRRLVLMASLVGAVRLPKGATRPVGRSVRQVIGGLPPLEIGQTDPYDPLHSARRLSELNLARIRASKPGGTWHDWPEELLADCHRKPSGASFTAFYGRMTWDEPAPTITTQSFNPGTGRFGHPEQDRTLTLREAAMLQGFPKGYEFLPPGERPSMHAVGRLIGNAVPPPFGRAVGETFTQIVQQARLTA